MRICLLFLLVISACQNHGLNSAQAQGASGVCVTAQHVYNECALRGTVEFDAAACVASIEQCTPQDQDALGAYLDCVAREMECGAGGYVGNPDGVWSCAAPQFLSTGCTVPFAEMDVCERDASVSAKCGFGDVDVSDCERLVVGCSGAERAELAAYLDCILVRDSCYDGVVHTPDGIADCVAPKISASCAGR